MATLAFENYNNTELDFTGEVYESASFINCQNLCIKNLTISSTAPTAFHLLNCFDVRIHNININGNNTSKYCINVCASDFVNIDGGVIQNAINEAVVVAPGHNYMRTDGHLWGSPYQPGRSLTAIGMNVLGFSGDGIQHRKGTVIAGVATIPIVKDGSGYFWRFPTQDQSFWLPRLTFYCYDGITEKIGSVVSLTDTNLIMNVALPDGDVCFYAIDENLFSKNITIKNLTIDGSTDNSGISLYGCDGFYIFNVTTRNTRDYGIGVEWSKNGLIHSCTVENTFDNWNKIEVVFYSSKISVINSSQCGVRPWGARCSDIWVRGDARMEWGYHAERLGRKVGYYRNVRGQNPLNHQSYYINGYFKPLLNYPE